MLTNDIRNVCIIAHVDHGKTTLVDALLRATGTVKSDGDLIMDSMDLERERGITIKAKNASLNFNGVKINLIDTPGHADFGGEVERTLRMADGCLLLVDAQEGPMPQTRFVLKKALELGQKVIVVINKVDKPHANPEQAINKTFDLFVHLHATDAQLDFPIVYSSGVRGLADTNLETLKTKLADPNSTPDVTTVFEAILKFVPAPKAQTDGPFSLLVLALDYDNYKGKIAVGKILSGQISKGQNLVQIEHDGTKTTAKVTALTQYSGLSRIDAEKSHAGDIVGIAGFGNIHIGDTLADVNLPTQIEPVKIEPPTVKISLGVNTSPLAGQEGSQLTSRQIRDRLEKELETNVAMKVEEMQGEAGKFLVSGRGELHLAILIETLRREGFELEVGQPQVIYQEIDGQKNEPFEYVTIDAPGEYQGVIIEALGGRGAELQTLETGETGDVHLEYLMPTRQLIGLKNLLLTRTRGSAILNNLFDSYKPVSTSTPNSNQHGSLIASESGTSSSYGLNNAQERGTLFIGAGQTVYEGMVVGQNALDNDLEVNVCKAKKLSNMRTSSSDEAIILTPYKVITLDFALEYIGNDELAEITPENIRIRKKLLSSIERKRSLRE